MTAALPFVVQLFVVGERENRHNIEIATLDPESRERWRKLASGMSPRRPLLLLLEVL